MRPRFFIRSAAARVAEAIAAPAGAQPAAVLALVALVVLVQAAPATAANPIVDDFESGPYTFGCSGTCTSIRTVQFPHAIGVPRITTIDTGPAGWCNVELMTGVADDELKISGKDWRVKLQWMPHPTLMDLTGGGVQDRFRVRLTTTSLVNVTVDVRSSFTDPGVAWTVTAGGDVEIPFSQLTANGADLTNVVKLYVIVEPLLSLEVVDTEIQDIRTSRVHAGLLHWDVVSGLFNWCPTCEPGFASADASTGGAFATFQTRERIQDVAPADAVGNIRVDCFDDGGDAGVYGESAGSAVTWEGGPYSASAFEFATDFAQVRNVAPKLASPPVLTAVDSSMVAMQYVIRLEDANTGALLGNCVETVFWDVFPGQGLRFDDVSATPIEPALRGAVTGGVLLSFTLKPTGPVDTALPLVTSMTVGDWAEGAAPTAVTRVTSGAPHAGLSAAPSVTRAGTRLLLSSPRQVPGTLSLVDAAGRLVQRLDVAAGATEVHWNGRGRSGAALPAGVYFASMPDSGRRLTTRIVLVR